MSGQGADEVFAGYHWHQTLMNTQNVVDDYAKVFVDYPFETYKTIVQSPYIQNDFSRQFIEKELSGKSFFSGDRFHLIDAVYGPIFRYFEVFDSFTELNTFAHLPKCQLWRKALSQRKSVQQAVSEDYLALLIQFLINRDSYISQLIR